QPRLSRLEHPTGPSRLRVGAIVAGLRRDLHPASSVTGDEGTLGADAAGGVEHDGPAGVIGVWV
nr:hypothetical protein [Ilumatobacteraceae bacterium]